MLFSFARPDCPPRRTGRCAKPAVFALALALGAAPLLAAEQPTASASAAEQEPAPPAAPSAAEIALAREIVALGYPEDTREALFFATMDESVIQLRAAIASSLPEDDPGAIAILDAWIADYTQASKDVLRKHIPDIMAGMVEGYATIFTPEELTDILAFVRTPSGRRYFELSPAISSSARFAAANERYADELSALLPPAQAELRARLDDYLTKQATRSAPPET